LFGGMSNRSSSLTKEITFVDENNHSVAIPWLYVKKIESQEYEFNEMAKLGRRLIRYLKELQFLVVEDMTPFSSDIIQVSFEADYVYRKCFKVKFEFVYKFKRVRTDLDPDVTFDQFALYLQSKLLKTGQTNEKIQSRINFYYNLVDMKVFIDDLELMF
jgi:hypothetical protein